MCLAQGPRRSDAGEAPTRCPSVSSQALYHWATALPLLHNNNIQLLTNEALDMMWYRPDNTNIDRGEA